jgi:hypothetical protein
MPQEMPEYMKKEILERFNKSFEIKCKDCEAKEIAINELEEIKGKYYELLFAVAHKCNGESRHETALRYILEHESGTEWPCSTVPATEP